MTELVHRTSEGAVFDRQEWQEHLLSQGSKLWGELATADSILAQDFAERTYERPGHPDEQDWADLSRIHSDLAIESWRLAQEAEARGIE
jgi:hypothetical protein